MKKFLSLDFLLKISYDSILFKNYRPYFSDLNSFYYSMSRRSIVILAVIGLLLGAKSQAYSTFSDGTLIRGSGPEVYVLEHGVKRWIPDPTIFKNLFYDWEKIKNVTDETLNGFPSGAKISSDYSDGALLRFDKSPKVFLLDNSRLRWVPDPNIFNSNNFSWENIVAVPDSWIRFWNVGTDVKSGEFLLLPTSFITTKPPAEIKLMRVTFSYSGANPTGPVSDLAWDTFLDGYDAYWQSSGSNYTRTIDLPGVNKTYTFYVRSRNKDGKIDSHPASYSFKVIGFSPSYSQLKILTIKASGSSDLDEYVTVINYSATSIDITGLIIKNKNNDAFSIPGGSEYLQLGSSYSPKDIILEPNKKADIFSGPSPIGKNFLLNKCIGYLNNFYNFSPRLPQECPRPIDQDIISLNENCRNYINSLPVCATPDTGDIRVGYDKQCTDYLTSTLNYSGCVMRYQVDPDFLKIDWYLYLNRTSGFWNDSHDEAELVDKDGNLISSYSY